MNCPNCRKDYDPGTTLSFVCPHCDMPMNKAVRLRAWRVEEGISEGQQRIDNLKSTGA